MDFWKRKDKSGRKDSRAVGRRVQKYHEIAEPLEPRYLLSTLPFTFNLATPASTSAGVYNAAGTLVRTLWSGEKFQPGSFQESWDGNLDNGSAAPAGSYTVKLLYGNTENTWQGVIGNTSNAFQGIHQYAQYSSMRGVTFTGNSTNYTGYVAGGYEEGSVLGWTFTNTTGPNSPSQMAIPAPDGGVTLDDSATDGTNIYYANIGGAINESFVFAIQASTDTMYSFGMGSPNVRSTYYAIDDDPTGANRAGGLDVEKSGAVLAVTVPALNEVLLYNKTTGALLQTLTDATHMTAPGRIAFAPNSAGSGEDLWVISGTNLLHYANSGTDAAPSYTYSGMISGFTKPLDIAINPANTTTGEIVVADGGTSQQVKAYSFAGTSLWTYGALHGYSTSPQVTNSKLFLDSTYGVGATTQADPQSAYTFLAFQPGGSTLWVGDGGNARTLILNDTGSSTPTYQSQVSYLPAFYNIVANPVAHANGTYSLYAGYLEYKFDPTVPLLPGDPNAAGGNGSWTLVNNWGTGLPSNRAANSAIYMVTTLGNGVTYGAIRDGSTGKYELVTLPATGGGVMQLTSSAEFGLTTAFEANGDLRTVAISNATGSQIMTVTEQSITSFGGTGGTSPVWGTATTLASAPVDPTTPTADLPGGYDLSHNLAVTSGNMLVSFNGLGGDLSPNSANTTSTMHLGGIPVGGTAWNWQAMPSAYLQVGDDQGTFEMADAYGQADATGVFAAGHNVITTYNGQYNTYSERYTDFNDDGLLIASFGANNIYAGKNIAPAGVSGNNNSAVLAVGNSIYIFNSDESQHSGIGVWKIDKTDSVHEMSASGTLGGTRIALVDPNAPVADYHADNGGGTTLADSSANANNGTLTSVGYFGSTNTYNIIGNNGGAGSGGSSLSYPATGTAYADIPNSSSINFAGNITLSAWVKVPSDSVTADIMTHGSLASGNQVFLRINNGNYEVGVDVGGTITMASAAVSPSDAGNWILLTGTYDGAKWNIYANGALKASTTSAQGATTVAADWYFGSNPSDSSWNLNSGVLDDIAIYARALNADEVLALANSGGYGGTTRAINGNTFAAANYDLGGDGVGYHSGMIGNFLADGTPGVYRNDNVSVETTSDTATGHQLYDITNTKAGEWFAYTGYYGGPTTAATPTLRVSNVVGGSYGNTSAEADIIVNGALVDRVAIPVGAAWQSVAGPAFNLTQGTNRIVVLIENGTFNFESISFATSSPSLVAPAVTSVTPGTSSTIGVTWNPVPGATSYLVHWGTTPGVDATGSPVTVNNPNTNFYTITGLSPNTTYYVTVQAKNATTTGAASASFAATTYASGTTTPINFAAGFHGSPLTSSSAFDPATNLVFNQSPHISIFPQLSINSEASITADGRLNLTTGQGQDQGDNAIYRSLVNVSNFTTNFTIQNGGSSASANGLYDFVLNSDSPHNVGLNNGYFAHGTTNAFMGQSVAISFTTSNTDTGTANSIQLGINGQLAASASLANTGVNLGVVGTYGIQIQYDGSTIFVTVTDMATQKSATRQFAINLPATLGSTQAYAGLVGAGALGGSNGRIDVLAWSYASSGSYTVPTTPISTLTDVNVGTATGSITYSAGVYSGTSGGFLGYGGPTDNFNFDYTPWTGDGILIAKITSESETIASHNNINEPLITFRDSTANNAITAELVATPIAGIQFFTRTATGANSTKENSYGPGNGSFDTAYPSETIWLKLVRMGSSMSAYYSSDNVTWHQVGVTQTINFSNTTIDAGIGLAAGFGTDVTTATFSNVSLTRPAPPANLSQQDVGSTPAPGNSSHNPLASTYTVAGTGDIANGGTSDSFHFDYQTWTPAAGTVLANGVLTANVVSQGNVLSGWDKAGVMFRDNNTANLAGAQFASVLVTPSNGVLFAWRSTTGGATSWTQVTGVSGPVYVRLVDNGGVFTAFYSSTGTTWTQIGTAQTIAFSTGTTLSGLVSASGSTSLTTASTATFNNYSFSAYIDADINSPARTGSIQASSPAGTYTIAGGGSGVTGTSDQFNFASQSWSGSSGYEFARVASQSAISSTSEAGVMFRNSSAANSIFAATFLTPGNGVEFMYRSTAGGAVTTSTVAGIVGPVFVKTLYSGTSVSGYYSVDGVTWTQIGTTATVAGFAPTLVGLAVSSMNTSYLGYATFTNVDPGRVDASSLSKPKAASAIAPDSELDQRHRHWFQPRGLSPHRRHRST